MIQVRLERETGQGTKLTLAPWVEYDARIKEGNEITLKDSEAKNWWKIVEVYNITLEAAEVQANRNWDNNNYDKHNTTSMKERLK